MANHDYVIDNGTGSAVRADINSALQAITTTNSGNSAPSTIAAGMLWWDSDGNTLYIRNTANNAWLPIGGATLTSGDILPDADNTKALGSDAARWGSLKCGGTVTFGWGSASAPGLGISADTNTGLYRAAADAIGFTTGGTTRARLDSDGLKFGSDTAAANGLDDYEEGTWTATLTGSTSNPSSAVTVTGQYTKVGNLVYVCAYFAGVNNTGAAGGIRVTGLPFTPSPNTQMSGAVSMHTIGTFGSGAANLSPYFQSSYVSFYSSPSAAGWSEVTHNASGAVWLNFSGTYKV